MASLEDIYDILNQAIEYAFFEEKYQLNFYEYLRGENFKQQQIKDFNKSHIKISIDHQIEELELYLDGGDRAAFVREAYSWLGKPRARKIKEYFESILEDANRYEQSKRRGRKPGSKNKKKPTSTTNK